ncbi:MAG: class I SAM-dependent methyltransferase [Proteobacteria bacterium]|nr:class I SAM-dependent methyltransferase [Pseudomonadota bacterium]
MLGRLRRRSRKDLPPEPSQADATPLGWTTPWGILDWINIDPTGLIRIFGWSYETSERLHPPRLRLGDDVLELNKLYRCFRPDVPASPRPPFAMPGFVFEYLVPEAWLLRPAVPVSVEIEGHPPKVIQPRPFTQPGLYELFHSKRVLGRDQIYGFGPPGLQVHPEVLALVESTRGSVLDFGCGAGPLVAAMRAQGREAFGIELDRGPIRDALLAEAAPYVRLYDGRLPMPFGDKSFDVVVATEVVEHIEDYRAAIAEIARICRRQAILTVPDMSAIPLGSRHGLIPWHLLESTHLNFFTQESLFECLKPFFQRVNFGRIAMTRVQETVYFVSLVACCEMADFEAAIDGRA